MGYFFLCDKDGNILQVDGTNLVVKIGDGTDIADVETLVNQDVNLDGLNGLITASEMYARENSLTSKPVRMISGNFAIGSNKMLVTAAAMNAYNGTQMVRLRVDPLTETLQVIDHPHHEIHQGSFFNAYHFNDLAGTTSMYYHFIVAAGKALHITMDLFVEAELLIYIYEAPTTLNDGTLITAYDRNRDTGNTPTALVHHSPNITANGTQIAFSYVPAGKFSSGGQSTRFEWIFKKSTKYLVRIQNLLGTASQYSVNFDWYEE